MRRAASLVLAGVLWASVAGVVPSAASAAVTTINFWHGITASDGLYLTDMIKKFEKEHPDIQIKQQGIGWEQLFEKVIVSLAANAPPQLFVVHPEEFYWFEKANAMRNMADYVNGPGGIPKDDRVESAWKNVYRGTKVLGVPLDNHNFNMWYNTEMFSQAGLDPNSPPTNLVDFMMAAKKTTKIKASGSGFDKMGYTYTWNRCVFISLMYQFGGTLLNPDNTKATFAEAPGLKALQLLQDWRNKDKIGDWGGVGTFTGNKAAMMFEGPWNLIAIQKVKNLKWAPAVMPTLGDRPGTWTSGHILCTPPSNKGKALAATWTFMKWMSDHSGDWAHAGQIPVRKTALASADFKSLPMQPVFAKSLPYAVFEPAVRRQLDIRAVYEPMIDAVVSDKGDVKQLATRSADQVNKVLLSFAKK